MTPSIVTVNAKRILTSFVFMLCLLFSMNLSAQFFNPSGKEFIAIELQSAKPLDEWKTTYIAQVNTIKLSLNQDKIQPQDLALYSAQIAVLEYINTNYNPSNMSIISEAYKTIYNTLDDSPVLKYTPKDELYIRCVAMIEFISTTPKVEISKL